jgi:hypothetical protein
MAHPRMFDDDDPMLDRVRDVALALPGAQEKISHGRPAFFTGRIHCYYGGSVAVEGRWVQHPRSVLLHLPPSETAALSAEPRAFVPAYLGPSGWIGLDLADGTDEGEMRELAELIEESYRTVAPRRLLAELDARPGGTA